MDKGAQEMLERLTKAAQRKWEKVCGDHYDHGAMLRDGRCRACVEDLHEVALILGVEQSVANLM